MGDLLADTVTVEKCYGLEARVSPLRTWTESRVRGTSIWMGVVCRISAGFIYLLIVAPLIHV